jgi:NAD(P)-dependent dehydrogenase (short-subunit alcohol dehydrogenase family)
MQGTLVMITGATSGLGKETAIILAGMGSRLVLVNRDPAKGMETKMDVVRLTGNQGVELIVADLLLQKELVRVAAEFGASHQKLDVLINNAGTVYSKYGETEDGIERTMAVNYFAPFLLTNLLLGQLKVGAPSRIINVASTAHYSGKLDIKKLGKERQMGLGGLGAYSRSKVALVLFTYELARRLQGTGVTANCLHPGAVRTNIWGRSGAYAPIARFASLFMRSAKRGAETQVYLASSPDVESVTGKYFEDCRPKQSSAASYDKDLARRLWEESEKMVGMSDSPRNPVGIQP